MTTDQKKKRPKLVLISLGVNLVLVMGMLFMAGMLVRYTKELAFVKETLAPVSPDDGPEDPPFLFDEPAEDSAEDSIPVAVFKKNVREYGASVEFVQQFFEDQIVYVGDNGFEYASIRDDLKKHDYDWNYLGKDAKGRKIYESPNRKGEVGIDVSEFQGEIDWQKVREDGISFAIIRLGYRGYGTGKLMLDKYFHENMEGAIEAGIPVGVYLYSQATTVEEAVEEADLVLENLKDYELQLPVILDVEEVPSGGRTAALTSEQFTDFTLAFCEEIEKNGYKAMVYANTKWFLSKLDMERLEPYGKWLAQYYREPFFPYSFTLWQYSDQGIVDGIQGKVDLNLGFWE